MAVLSAAACAGNPILEAVEATDAGVAYRFDGDQRDEAAGRADLYCANLGKRAVLAGVGRQVAGATIVRFECR